MVRRVTGRNPDGHRRLEALCSSDVDAIVADGEEGSRAFGRLPGTSNGTVVESSRRSSGRETADLGPLNSKVRCGEPVTTPAEKSSGNQLKMSPKNRAVSEAHVFSGNRKEHAHSASETPRPEPVPDRESPSTAHGTGFTCESEEPAPSSPCKSSVS